MMEAQRLPLKIHDEIFEIIKRRVFQRAEMTDHPEIYILGGQPGSGKSTLLPLLGHHRNIVAINGDEFREFHPFYKRIIHEAPERMAELTDPDVRRWTKRLFDEAIQRHYNIAFESTMRQDEPLCTTLGALQREGYKIVACVMAVHESDSLIRCEMRYQRGVEHKGTGRRVPLESHNEAYANMPHTLKRIENEGFADEIRIYDHNQQELFRCTPDQEISSSATVLDIREKRGREIAKKLTSRSQIAEPGSTHIGKIVLVTDTHVYQATEKGIILHKAQSLDVRPKLGADLWIGYCKEKGYTRLAKPQELGRGLGR